MMKVESMVLGMVQTNCYLLSDRESGACIIVDPADSPQKIISRIQAEHYEPVAILLTHGHYDHILAVEALRKEYSVQVYAARAEEALLGDPGANLSLYIGGESYSTKADVYLSDQEEFTLAGHKIKAILTPGHTSGSMCYYFQDSGFLISGDMVFCESVGRTDFPTGNSAEIISSLKEKIFALPDGTIIYPGHGPSTDVAHEKAYNPYA